MDLGLRRALAADRRAILSAETEWLTEILGIPPRDTAHYERALTHGSHGADNYQRLEFLGDRVLGLAMAEWLSERFPQAREGELSHRFTTLVSGATCAAVAREIGVRPHLRLGKQARGDGAIESDNILGDALEALIGALYIEHGFPAAASFVRRHWAGFLDGQSTVPRHPKSLLHEWAEANNRRPPTYTLAARTGPDHAPRFSVTASLGSAGEASGDGSSKQEAETAAAAALLAKLT